MTDEPGIYPKYVVFKHPKVGFDYVHANAVTNTDGFSMRQQVGLEPVDDFVFVLKPIKDKHARVAMAAYAESIKEEKPQLAKDLYEILGDY